MNRIILISMIIVVVLCLKSRIHAQNNSFYKASINNLSIKINTSFSLLSSLFYFHERLPGGFYEVEILPKKASIFDVMDKRLFYGDFNKVVKNSINGEIIKSENSHQYLGLNNNIVVNLLIQNFHFLSQISDYIVLPLVPTLAYPIAEILSIEHFKQLDVTSLKVAKQDNLKPIPIYCLRLLGLVSNINKEEFKSINPLISTFFIELKTDEFSTSSTPPNCTPPWNGNN